ncbi:MAG: hypothetical protein SGBAC_009497 [Bacillariaceae sp.]
MAIGPFARVLAQLVVPVVAVLARAIPAAWGQAVKNAQKSGVAAEAASAPVFGKKISRSEALSVLNLTEEEATPEAIQKQFDRYFKANDVSKGGSFYLQSKVYVANELLKDYQAEKRQEEQQEQKGKKEQ